MSTWDRRGSGSREYEEDQYQRVVAELRNHHVGHEHRIRTEDLTQLLGVSGRTIRSIFNALDGREFVLGQGDDGVFVATCAEDAEPGTRRLEAQARRMFERAQRRREFSLPKMQESLL
jgi:DNA-binding GntR family transcriptional regulator